MTHRRRQPSAKVRAAALNMRDTRDTLPPEDPVEQPAHQYTYSMIAITSPR